MANSRTERWQDASAQLQDAVAKLQDIRQEYVDWLDGMPDSLRWSGSPMVEKLEAIEGIDMDELEYISDEIASADLPLGFGRD